MTQESDQPNGAAGGFTTNSGARSASRYGDPGLAGFISRSFAKSMGFSDDDLRKPVIGIAQTWSEFNNCHQHFKELAEAVKRGIWQAGGLPLEFPTISLGEIFLSPTSMFFRNLMAIDTEEMIRAQPMNGVVLLGACDKTIPAQLMGAASADIPTIMLTGGPTLSGRWNGRDLGACTDCRGFWTEYRAGTIDSATLADIEDSLCRSAGHCTVMGTASTMSSACEALGIALPGVAAIPAPDSRRYRIAEATGKQIVKVVEMDLRPSRIMTRPAFENAIRVMMALGGSTNAVVHLLAIAGRLGIGLTLDDFDRLARETPLIANIRPSGRWQMEQLFEAGGIPAVMKELLPLLDGDCITVTGQTLAENVRDHAVKNPDVIRPLADPLAPEGGLAILRGNLAPDGAVIKHAAATPGLLKHRGRAVVFTSVEDMTARVDDPNLDVTADSVMVMQNAGPVGAPGMPEAGNLPIPKKLLEQGIRDMVRISDARMSGTAYGTVVLHIAPEAAVGGPLALVRDGDWIELDVPNRRLTLDVPDKELAARRAAWAPPAPRYARGWGRIYVEHVMQANHGADLDILLPARTPAERTV
ncbi:MAG: dihydroxy-acid dehydratase [Chloroflexi bacterium]|nr:dihydroxy-acid dehydratase [Chloroflexota bacterium]